MNGPDSLDRAMKGCAIAVVGAVLLVVGGLIWAAL
jgi:hypothetical protein